MRVICALQVNDEEEDNFHELTPPFPSKARQHGNPIDLVWRTYCPRVKRLSRGCHVDLHVNDEEEEEPLKGADVNTITG